MIRVIHAPYEILIPFDLTAHILMVNVEFSKNLPMKSNIIWSALVIY